MSNHASKPSFVVLALIVSGSSEVIIQELLVLWVLEAELVLEVKREEELLGRTIQSHLYYRTKGASLFEARNASFMSRLICDQFSIRPGQEPALIIGEFRLDLAIELYQSGASDRLLMSGDHSRKDYDEVSAMRNYAADRQVALSHIFLDHAGFSTYESLYRARDIFGAERILIVTQRYHLYRALYIADALGLEARGVAADARSYARQPYYTLREIAARSKDFLYTIVQPAPTYLGDAIPLSGDGRVTGQLSWHPLV